jgi:hypothetical protein
VSVWADLSGMLGSAHLIRKMTACQATDLTGKYLSQAKITKRKEDVCRRQNQRHKQVMRWNMA